MLKEQTTYEYNFYGNNHFIPSYSCLSPECSVFYGNGVMEEDYCIERVKFQTIAYCNLKKKGFHPENGSELYVKRIPFYVRVEDLIRYFGQVGKIFQIRLMMTEDFNENRGYAYISYMNATMAHEALKKLNQKCFGGVNLSIEPSLNNCRIFVGGVPVTKTKDEVWQQLQKKGIKNVVDVIMYRSYTQRAHNRGFVFVEFKTHEDAARFRAKYINNLKLWDIPLVIDWSVPIPEVDKEIMKNVRNLYLRNLDVCESRSELEKIVLMYVSPAFVERVFKFKNYAFIHLKTRAVAEKLIENLREHYDHTIVEVEWAKPPNKYTSHEYRHRKMSSLTTTARVRNNSSGSSDYFTEHGGNSTSPVSKYPPRYASTPVSLDSISHLDRMENSRQMRFLQNFPSCSYDGSQNSFDSFTSLGNQGCSTQVLHPFDSLDLSNSANSSSPHLFGGVQATNASMREAQDSFRSLSLGDFQPGFSRALETAFSNSRVPMTFHPGGYAYTTPVTKDHNLFTQDSVVGNMELNIPESKANDFPSYLEKTILDLLDE